MSINLITICLLLLLTSCSVKTMAVRKISEIVDKGIKDKVFAEDNLVYANHSLPANLKLLEIIHLEEKNLKNASNLSLGLCGYGYAFWENEREIANSFIKKGLFYSSDFISEKNLTLTTKNSKKTLEIFFSQLFCKVVYLDINKDDVSAHQMFSDIEEEVQNIYQIDPNYFYGFVKAIKAYITASKPSIVGGSTDKAKEIFEEVILNNDFLLNKYLYMRYAILVLDEELFDRMYEEIMSWQNHNSPYAFFNKIAQMKAKKLKEAKNEYF